jgi:hypothetical protein
MSSEKPDQIQASVAAALSRLRGDLGPTGATAPKIDEPPMGGSGDRPRPANDVRGDPFFRSIQPPPGTGMAGRGAIPMTPFPRMQAPQEPAAQEPVLSDEPKDEETTLEPAATIEIPDMPEREETPDPVSMPEPPSMSEAMAPLESEAAPQPTPEAQSAAAAAAAAANPLARMMRGPGQPGAAAPAQRDLLADLPPPPISGPLTVDTESSASRRRRRNRRLLAAAAAIVVIVLGAWLWTKGEPSAEVPVVTADATPEKVKPAEEGGLQVQNQDVQVLDPSTQTQAETVMPEPEQPITPPAATDAPAAEQAPTVVENTESNAAPTVEAPAADVAPSPDVPLAETPLPAMEENGTTEAAPAAPAAAAPEQTQTAETPAATEPAPATTAETTPAPAATPEPAAPEAAAQPEPAQSAQPEQPAQAAQPEPAPAEQPAAQEAPAQQAAVTPVAPTGNTRVQLAAGKSEAAVQKDWAALQKAHPDLLGPLSLHIERVDKGASGIFYRLQAGPLADKNAAKELCASLKQKGQDCLVVAK